MPFDVRNHNKHALCKISKKALQALPTRAVRICLGTKTKFIMEYILASSQSFNINIG